MQKHLEILNSQKKCFRYDYRFPNNEYDEIRNNIQYCELHKPAQVIICLSVLCGAVLSLYQKIRV